MSIKNRNELILSLSNDGFNSKQIAEAMKISDSRVRQILISKKGAKNMNAPRPEMRRVKMTDDEMLLLHQQGKSLDYIAKQNDVSRQSIYYLIRKLPGYKGRAN